MRRGNRSRARSTDEAAKGFDDERRQRGPVGRLEQLVTGTFNREELGAGRDEGEGSGHVVESAEAVAGTGDEERRRFEARKVLGPELVGAARRVERVGEQEQSVNQSWLGGGEHGGLASTIRVSAEEESGQAEAAEGLNSGAQTCLILIGTVAGRSVGAELAEGQIAAKDGES
jgi:hypothetical protein